MRTIFINLAFCLSCVALPASAALNASAVTTYSDRTAFTLASSGLQTIDFEGIATPSDPYVSFSEAVGYQTPDVWFIGRIDDVPNRFDLYIADQTYQSPSFNWNSGDSLTFRSRGDVTAYFKQERMTALGFDFMAAYTSTPGVSFTITLSSGEMFDLGVPFTSSSLGHPERAFFGVTSTVPISWVAIETTVKDFATRPMIDNFSFGKSAVPEPSVIGFLVAGMVALVAKRKRA